jgi:hypothetical protein
MGKTVNIGKRPSARPSAEDIDKWIEGQGETGEQPPSVAATPPKVKASKPIAKMKRLTIDIPDSLHRRVKSQCGQDGLRMADVIRDLLEKRFPDSP